MNHKNVLHHCLSSGFYNMVPLSSISSLWWLLLRESYWSYTWMVKDPGYKTMQVWNVLYHVSVYSYDGLKTLATWMYICATSECNASPIQLVFQHCSTEQSNHNLKINFTDHRRAWNHNEWSIILSCHRIVQSYLAYEILFKSSMSQLIL